ncbi:hypothetical protein V8E36_004972 [Tilletia maclaganii]
MARSAPEFIPGLRSPGIYYLCILIRSQGLPAWIDIVAGETARWPGVAGTHDAPAHPMPGLEGWVTVTTTDLSAPTHQPGLLIHRLEALQHTVQALPPPEARNHRRTRPWASTTDTPLKTQTIRLLPSTQQKEALNKAAGIARWSFNRAVAYLRQHPLCGTTQLRQATINKASYTPDQAPWATQVPYNIREAAVLEAHTAWQNGRAAVASGSVQRFELHFRGCRAGYRSFRIRSRDWRGGTLHLPQLGVSATSPIATSEFLSSMAHDGISVEERNGKWLVHFPVPAAEEDEVKPAGLGPAICAIDPGVTTFLTRYDPMRQLTIKFGMNDQARLFRLGRHLDNLISKAADGNAKQRRRRKRAVNRLRERIKNLVTDTHRRIANFLRRHYDTVLLPTFSAHQMSRRGRRRITKKTVRSMLTWAHGRFRAWLGGKVEVVAVREDWTSKTFSSCGWVRMNLGGARVHRCQACDTSSDRDVNAAKNIFLHYLFDSHVAGQP